MANRDFYGNWKSAGYTASQDSGFLSFIKNMFGSDEMSSLLGAAGSLVNPLLGIGLNLGTSILGDVLENKALNAHLTGKEREQNEFNAQQAQLNRDFQMEMSNTSYQRSVADMQAAGVNPALAMSNGGASTPTGSNAQGSATAFNPMGIMVEVMKSFAEMRMMSAQTKNVEAQTENTELQSDAQKIVNTYLDQKERLTVSEKEVSVSEAWKRIGKMDTEIDKMSAEMKSIALGWLQTLAEIDLLTANKELAEENKGLVAAKIGEANAAAAQLRMSNTLSQQMLDNWQFVNAKELKVDASSQLWVVGAKVGETLLVYPDGRIYSPMQNKFLEAGTGKHQAPAKVDSWNEIKKNYPE